MKMAYLKYIASLVLLGSNGIIAHYISLHSYEIVLIRMILGALTLIGIVLLLRPKMVFYKYPKEMLFLLVSGASMAASWLFLYEAFVEIGVSLATLALYCAPVIIMVLSPLLFNEKLHLWSILGFGVVLCGSFLVNGQVIQSDQSLWGLFCGLMSALAYASMVMFNKKTRYINGLENATIQLLVALTTVVLFFLIVSDGIFVIEPGEWPAVIVIGVLNTGVVTYLYFSSIDRLPVQSVAVCSYIEPLTAVVLATIVLNERMNRLQIIGAFMIVFGALWSEYMTQRYRRSMRCRDDRADQTPVQ